MPGFAGGYPHAMQAQQAQAAAAAAAAANNGGGGQQAMNNILMGLVSTLLLEHAAVRSGSLPSLAAGQAQAAPGADSSGGSAPALLNLLLGQAQQPAQAPAPVQEASTVLQQSRDLDAAAVVAAPGAAVGAAAKAATKERECYELPPSSIADEDEELRPKSEGTQQQETEEDSAVLPAAGGLPDAPLEGLPETSEPEEPGLPDVLADLKDVSGYPRVEVGLRGPVAPKAMLKPTIEAVGATVARVTWERATHVPDLIGYSLIVFDGWKMSYYDPDARSLVDDPEKGKPMPVDRLSARIRGLVPNVPYQAQIAAVSEEGPGPYSPMSEPLSLKAPALPAAPTAEVVDASHLLINWKTVRTMPEVTGYAVAVHDGTLLRYFDPKHRTLTTRADGLRPIPPDKTTVTVKGLYAGAEYSVALAAMNELGWSPYSAYSSAIMIEQPPAPPAPSVEVVSRHCIKVSWEASGRHLGVKGYGIALVESGHTIMRYFDWRSGALLSEAGAACPVPKERTSALVGGLEPHVKYKVRVAAMNGVGWGRYSPFSSATRIDVPPAMAPPRLEPVSETCVRVSWEPLRNAAPEITGYSIAVQDGRLKYYDSCTGALTEDPSELEAVPADRACVLITGLSLGATYYAKVAARNDIGWGKYSAFSDRMEIEVPQKLRQPTMEILDAESIKVSWTKEGCASAGIIGFAVVLQGETMLYYDAITGALSTDGHGLMPVPASERQVTIFGLMPGVSYRAKIAARNRVGWGKYSAFSEFVKINVPETPPQPVLRVVDRTSLHVSWHELRQKPPVTGFIVALFDGEYKYWDAEKRELVHSAAYAKPLPGDCLAVIIAGGLEPGMRYKAQVTAINAVGRSSPSPSSEMLMLVETQEMKWWPPLPMDLVPNVPRPRSYHSSNFSSVYQQACQELTPAPESVVCQRLVEALRTVGTETLDLFRRYIVTGEGRVTAVEAALRLWASSGKQARSRTFVALNRAILADQSPMLQPWMPLLRTVVERAISAGAREIERRIKGGDTDASDEKAAGAPDAPGLCPFGPWFAWRGSQLTRKQAESLHAGDIVCPPMFVSASTSRQVAEYFRGAYLVELEFHSAQQFAVAKAAAQVVGTSGDQPESADVEVVLCPYTPLEVIDSGREDIIRVRVLDTVSPMQDMELASASHARAFPI